MDIFDVPEVSNKMNDPAFNHRVEEIIPDGNQLSGTVRFRWTSAAGRHWVPRETAMRIDLQIVKSGNADVENSDNVQFAPSAGAALFERMEYLLNGVSCGSTSEPAVQDIMLKRIYDSQQHKETLGDSLYRLIPVNLNAGNTFSVWVQPPLGIFSYPGGIPGGQHQLVCQITTDFVNRIFTSGRAVGGLSVSIQRMVMFVASVAPVVPEPLPPSSVISLTEVAVSSQSVNSNGAITLTYTVPSSTYKCFVAGQLSNLSAMTDPLAGATTLRGCALSSQLQLTYAGQTVPTVAYTNTESDLRRAYFDLYRRKFYAVESAYENYDSWVNAPIFSMPFSKDPSDASTNLQLRFTSTDGATNNSQLFVSALHTNAIVITYGKDGYITSVSYVQEN